MTHSVRINDEQVTDRGTVDLDKQDVRLADGTRLTESKAQELAAEVLERSGRGRPSLSRPGVRSPQLRLSVPDELRSRLLQRAEDEHRSVSNLVRDALEHYLAS
ncbi:MAG: ribbon-helix-helix protein, CopG family [Actinomycetota bacterium]|nr:ribbon-helix-helix protein, CopG family [Actinomycetota bacterium]MDQ6947748.1 ribbon-helix-helix protein, CopG family [Actinomycetota bacterium]